MITTFSFFNDALELAQGLTDGSKETVAGRMRVSDKMRAKLIESYLEENPETSREEAEQELKPMISFAEVVAPSKGERPDEYIVNLWHEITNGDVLDALIGAGGKDG